jgi:hypothetical protein
MRAIATIAFFLALSAGGHAMAGESPTDVQLAELKKQVELLTQQLNLLNAQNNLTTAQQTQQAALAKAVLEAAKSEAAAQFALDTAQAQAPFAELSGIKAGLANAKLPDGMSGTMKVATGTAGTALLRSKGPLFDVLGEVVDVLEKAMPDGAVLVSEAEIQQALSSRLMVKLVQDQTGRLQDAAAAAQPKLPTFAPQSFAGGIAAAYSVGLVLDTVNSLAKLFRTDRSVDVFSADAEVLAVLGYLLQVKNSKFVTQPGALNDKAFTKAMEFTDQLRALSRRVVTGDQVIAQIKEIKDAKARPGASEEFKKAELKDQSSVDDLMAQLEAAKALLAALDPTKKPEAFWAQVKGQVIDMALEGRVRLTIEARAQTVQITESHWYSSDRLLAIGEAQVGYRATRADGSLVKSGLVLKASAPRRTELGDMTKLDWSR